MLRGRLTAIGTSTGCIIPTGTAGTSTCAPAGAATCHRTCTGPRRIGTGIGITATTSTSTSYCTTGTRFARSGTSAICITPATTARTSTRAPTGAATRYRARTRTCGIGRTVCIAASACTGLCTTGTGFATISTSTRAIIPVAVAPRSVAVVTGGRTGGVRG